MDIDKVVEAILDEMPEEVQLEFFVTGFSTIIREIMEQEDADTSYLVAPNGLVIITKTEDYEVPPTTTIH